METLGKLVFGAGACLIALGVFGLSCLLVAAALRLAIRLHDGFGKGGK